MPKTDKPRDSRRILVVDDEPRMTRFIRMNLDLEGFSVHEAFDGKEALDRVREVQVPARHQRSNYGCAAARVGCKHSHVCSAKRCAQARLEVKALHAATARLRGQQRRNYCLCDSLHRQCTGLRAVPVAAHSICNHKQTGLGWTASRAKNFNIGKQRILIACALQAGTLRRTQPQLAKSYRRRQLRTATGCGLHAPQRLRLRSRRALPPLSKTIQHLRCTCPDQSISLGCC